MQRKLIIATVLTAIGISGANVALAQDNGENQAADVPQEQLFLAATVSLDQASQIALKEVPGTLAAIGYNDENGQGLYEASVIGADGQTSIVKIDANTGAVLVSGLESMMDDESDGGDQGGDGENGGENSAENGGGENG